MTITGSKIQGNTKFEQFQHMRGIGYSEDEIMKELGIPTQDAFRQMDEKSEKLAVNYLKYLVNVGHIQNLINVLKHQSENVTALSKRAKAAATQADANKKDRKLVYAESHVRNTLTTAIQVLNELQKDVILAEGFNQFVKLNIIEGGTKRKGTNIHNMPVTPAELTN